MESMVLFVCIIIRRKEGNRQKVVAYSYDVQLRCRGFLAFRCLWLAQVGNNFFTVSFLWKRTTS